MPYSSTVRRMRQREAALTAKVSNPAKPVSRAEEARRELLDSISAFILDHNLDVTAVNLGLVSGALSGANTGLAEAFALRQASGEPIDQRWLDTVARLDPGTSDRMTELEQLMDRLEYSLMRFSQTAKSAQDETSDGREALGAQIEAMSAVNDGAAEQGAGIEAMAQMMELSRTMLERIEKVESAMERSQAESGELRENLAKARMEADVDHLTRLPNRRSFERRFESATKEALSDGKSLSVAFCDVDHFKAINDTHGHEAGDRILCAIANTLNEIAGDQCFVSRHGGEEFVMLFYGLDKEAAWRKLDGVRRVLASRRLTNRDTGKPFGKVTFSGGVAEVTDAEDPRSALASADEALYQAKKEGRNRIVAA